MTKKEAEQALKEAGFTKEGQAWTDGKRTYRIGTKYINGSTPLKTSKFTYGEFRHVLDTARRKATWEDLMAYFEYYGYECVSEEIWRNKARPWIRLRITLPFDDTAFLYREEHIIGNIWRQKALWKVGNLHIVNGELADYGILITH